MKKKKLYLVVISILVVALGLISLSCHKQSKKIVRKETQKIVGEKSSKKTHYLNEFAGGPEKSHRKMTREGIIELRNKFPGLIYFMGSKNERRVALTFDDGPDNQFTPKILKILKSEKVPATFFLVGKRVKAYPNVAKQIVNNGHTIGNHTWDHPILYKKTTVEKYSELQRAEEEIYKTVGLRTRLFRPPYGILDEQTASDLSKLQYKVIEWSVDTQDWKGRKADEIVTEILRHAENGSIILQHSAGGRGENLSGTVEALPKIIKALKALDYEFVTVPELLGLKAYE